MLYNFCFFSSVNGVKVVSFNSNFSLITFSNSVANSGYLFVYSFINSFHCISSFSPLIAISSKFVFTSFGTKKSSYSQPIASLIFLASSAPTGLLWIFSVPCNVEPNPMIVFTSISVGFVVSACASLIAAEISSKLFPSAT